MKKAKTKERVEPKEHIDTQASTLVGDLRDDILGIFKSHGDWKKLKEAQQRDIATGAHDVASRALVRMADIIAGRGFKSIHATLASVMVKDGLKLVLTASKGVEGRGDLLDHQGNGVTVVIKDINAYLGQRSEPEIDKDEPVMFDDETGEVIEDEDDE
jgi:hypothetical protein